MLLSYLFCSSHYACGFDSEITDAPEQRRAGAALQANDDVGSALPTSFHCRRGLLTIELRSSSEGNASGDLRAVQHRVEFQSAVLVLNAECPVTDLSENLSGQVHTEHGFHFPHQIGTDTESSDLAANCCVICFVKVVAKTQPDVGIKPVIVPRDTCVQLRVEDECELVGDFCLGCRNDPVDRGTTCLAHQMQRIYA